MAFHVRDKETDALVRELAAERRIGLTEAIKQAVSAELERARGDAAARLARMQAIREDVARWPRTGLKADKAFFDDLSGD